MKYFFQYETLKFDISPDDSFCHGFIEVSKEIYDSLLVAVNRGCIIFSDLSISTPRPTTQHYWNGKEWIDSRTSEEIETARLAQFKPLTRRQFKLTLLNHGLLDKVENAIKSIPDEAMRLRIEIEYQEANNILRTNEAVKFIIQQLELTEVEIQHLWKYGQSL